MNNTPFSVFEIIRQHVNQSSTRKFAAEAPTKVPTLSSAAAAPAPAYHGEPPATELPGKSLSGGSSGSTGLSPFRLPAPAAPTPTPAVYDLPSGSPGLGLQPGMRTDGSAMENHVPPPTAPAVTGISSGFNNAVSRESTIKGDRAYNAQRFPANDSGVSPEMLAQFRRNTGSNYNPKSRMDQHNMQLLMGGGQTVNAQQFRSAPGLLAKTAAINRLKQFLGITKTAAPDARDIVDMNSTGGKLGDYLAALQWGGERAGRSTAMADAAGMDTSFNLRHPGTSEAGYTLGGALLGAMGGGLLLGGASAGVGKLMGRDSDHIAENFGAGGTVGGVVGAVGGGIGGHILSALRRREEMRKVNDEYDRANKSGDLRPKSPNFSVLSALLLPFRGAHRTGQLEAVNAMRGGKSIDDAHTDGRDVLYTGQRLPYAGAPIAALHGWGQNLRTQLADKMDRNPRK